MTDDLSNRLQAAIGRDYLIDRELGGGGMSRVFMATERALERRVVIKVLPPDLAAGVNHERFRREIQLAAQLQHPHIVPLLTAGEQGGLLYFTMPFIEGESLRAALARRGRFPTRDVLRVLHDIVDALAYAHARGVVHRDIKPGNILTSGMHALVTDFGVAKALSAATPTIAVGTTTGMAIGTPAYMAPEQLAADPAADHRMDIYAVGLLAYELLTGKTPFSGQSPQATLAAQLTQTPAPPNRELPDVPAQLSDIVMRCLEKDAARRPQSAAQLLDELDALPQVHSGEMFASARSSKKRGPLIALAVVLIATVSYVMAQKFVRPEPGAPSANSIAGALSDTANRARNLNVLGGNGANGGSGSGGRGSVASAVRPETVYLRDPQDERDGKPSTQVPVVISRAESVAIADAIRKRQADASPIAGLVGAATNAATNAAAQATQAAQSVGSARSTTTSSGKVVILGGPSFTLSPIDRDSLFAEVRRIFADSAAKAFAHVDSALTLMPRAAGQRTEWRGDMQMVSPLIAPPSDGRRRIVVQPFNNGTGRREFNHLRAELADSIRNALIARGTFDVVDAEVTERASRGASNRVAIGWSLRADYVVNGALTMRGDSLVLVTVFAEVRGGQYTRVNEAAALISEPQRILGPTISRVNAWIDSARVMRPPQMRGGPPPGDRRQRPPDRQPDR